MAYPQHPENIKLHFILSTGRTGSTLLSTMFNMHPSVVSASEEPFAFSLYPKYKRISRWTSEIINEYCYDFYLFSEGKLEPQFGTQDDLRRILEEHKSQLNIDLAIKLTYLCFFPNKDKSNITTIVDKQLKFHYFLDKVAGRFPEAKFIILLRDPRDNSLVKWRRSVKQEKKGNYYVFGFMWWHVYSTLMKKKQNLGPKRFMEVYYENLMKDPEKELTKMCVFLGIDFHPLMLEYDTRVKEELQSEQSKQKLGSTVKQHIAMFHEGLTQKTSTDKIGFWKANMKQEEVNIVWTICGKLASKLGYEPPEKFKAVAGNPKFLMSVMYVYFTKVIFTKTYYALPFSVKYLIKKIRYRKNFRQGKYTTHDFYKTTLPKQSS